RRAVLTDHADAIPRYARAKGRGKTVASLVADPHLEDAMPVVLGPKLTHPTDLAERELEAMPIVRRRKRCHDKVDLTRSGRPARRWRPLSPPAQGPPRRPPPTTAGLPTRALYRSRGGARPGSRLSGASPGRGQRGPTACGRRADCPRARWLASAEPLSFPSEPGLH